MTERDNSVRFAAKIRSHALRMVFAAKSSHIGSCLSIADILAVLYSETLSLDPANPKAPDRDRFILSKGHAAAILYAALAERGFFESELLDTFSQDGSILTGHVSHAVAGVELSTGSLGHGLPVSVGIALALKADGQDSRAFCVLSDGECDEGSNWEAILFAPHHKLDNLVVIVDFNKIQSFGRVADVLNLEPFAAKWRAFGWHTIELDGHDHAALRKAFESVPPEKGRPTVIIAHTVKGKGVSYMEDSLDWHYKSPNEQQLAAALAQVAL